MMAIDVVLTRGKLFQLECHCQLVLVNFFGLQLTKTFFSCKYYFAIVFVIFDYVLWSKCS
jgi:hypothetical protein